MKKGQANSGIALKQHVKRHFVLQAAVGSILDNRTFAPNF
jgi:hypothetical protein